MTEIEYAGLKATLGAIDNAEFQCSKCLKKYDGRSDAAEILRKSRDNKGCFSVRDIDLHRVDDVAFSTCVGNVASPGFNFVIELYSKYAKGILPFDGALADQPNKLIEAFAVIEDWGFKKSEEQEKKRDLRNGLGKNRTRNNSKVRPGSRRA
jgi:hypothetical protein